MMCDSPSLNRLKFALATTKWLVVLAAFGMGLSACSTSSDIGDDSYSLNMMYNGQAPRTSREPDSSATFFDKSCDADRNPFPGVTTYDCSRTGR